MTSSKSDICFGPFCLLYIAADRGNHLVYDETPIFVWSIISSIYTHSLLLWRFLKKWRRRPTVTRSYLSASSSLLWTDSSLFHFSKIYWALLIKISFWMGWKKLLDYKEIILNLVLITFLLIHWTYCVLIVIDHNWCIL